MSSTHPRTHLGAIGIALFVTVLWSSSWVLIRWGLDGEGLTPITFAALRYGLAAVLLLAFMFFRERPREQLARVPRAMLVRIVALGVLMYALTQGAMFVSLDNQPATTTSLVLSMTPMLVAGVAAISLAETPTRRQVFGALLVMAGAWLYFNGDLGVTTLGLVAALVALGANVASSVLGRDVNRSAELSPVVVTALSMTVGAAILLAGGFVSEGVPSVSGKAWLIIVWLAVVNTAFAFTLWNLSLRRLTAVESAGINNTMLIQIAVLAWLFLDEAPGPAGIAGILVASIGIFLTQAVGARRQRSQESIS